MIFRYITTLIIAITSFSCLQAIDNPHFWRATNFLSQFYEPRLEKPWLTSFDMFASAGHTSSARNGKGDTVPLLGIYGSENIAALGKNIPLNLANPIEAALAQLALLPCSPCCGQLVFNGTFSLDEINICFTQNFTHGFFTQLHTPFRVYEVKNTSYTNLTERNCYAGCLPVSTDPNWQTVITQFNTMLEDFCVNDCNMKETGAGDTSWLFGWTRNYQDTTILDFIDFTVRLGILFPTGHETKATRSFDIANGYNGHYALPASMSCAIGYLDWVTAGIHLGAMPFFNSTQYIGMHTDSCQNGFIRLVKGCAKVHQGAIWEFNTYLKADHFGRGASLGIGYNVSHQNSSSFTPCSATICSTPLNTKVVTRCDSSMKSWTLHTINVFFEFDFANLEDRIGPRFGAFYNIQIGGKRVFKTNMAGGNIGFEVTHDF